MLPFEDRYSRQRRLAEVGPERQHRLELASLALGRHPDVELECEYLRRAGVSRLELEDDADVPAFPWAVHFRSAAALGVARGAWCALVRLRRELAREPV